MLFKEDKNFGFQFPEPQYLGAKHTHLAWIKKFIPRNVTTALDAFSGSQSVAFLFKQMWFTTFSNDFLNFNNQIGLALIENKEVKLTKEDIKLLYQPAANKIVKTAGYDAKLHSLGDNFSFQNFRHDGISLFRAKGQGLRAKG